MSPELWVTNTTNRIFHVIRFLLPDDMEVQAIVLSQIRDVVWESYHRSLKPSRRW